MNDRNRANVADSLDNFNQLLAETRPKISTGLDNFNNATERLAPLLEDVRKTVARVDQTFANVDSLLATVFRTSSSSGRQAFGGVVEIVQAGGNLWPCFGQQLIEGCRASPPHSLDCGRSIGRLCARGPARCSLDCGH